MVPDAFEQFKYFLCFFFHFCSDKDNTIKLCSCNYLNQSTQWKKNISSVPQNLMKTIGQFQ